VNAVNFIKEINLKDKVFLVSHNDADGVCSAALMHSLLSEFGINPSIVIQPIPPKKATFHSISWEEPDYLIILDIPMDQNIELLDKFTCKILIIDHHVSKDLSSKNIINVNPRFEKPEIYQPASYLVYKLAKKLGKPKAWVAAIGVIGDYGWKDCMDLFKDLKEQNPELYPGKDFLNSRIGNVWKTITAVKAVEGREGCEKFVKILTKAMSLEDVFRTKEGQSFLEDEKIIDEEIENIKMDFEKNAEFGDVVFYELGSKYKIRSLVASLFSKDNILAVYQREGNSYAFSLRSNSVDLARIVKKVSEKVGGIGGGHPVAAGATIPVEKLNEFKKLLVREVKSSAQR